ncbi:hypothetical protein M0R45_034181 [Rubus argutus]|uniref:Fungal lipase-type domain-containing protein n=1 Tax=Rubus argutus TaxID=59490 RepID=A0AAW1VUY0_RUBAR
MACASLSIPSSPASTRTIEVVKEQSGLRRSQSSKDLYNRASIRRSVSDNHLCYRIKPIHAASAQPKLKNSRGEQRREGQEIKRANWVERLVEIRSKWRNRQQEDVGDEDSVCHEGEDRDCECREGGCSVDYSSDEDDAEIPPELFSKFLVKVPWSDTKQFSQLAFLSNLAYVIPLIKADDLKKYYGLQFVTSSLQKKAEAEELKEKLDQDSTRVPVGESSSETAADSEQKCSVDPSVAYEIAASAASYVRSRDKDGVDVGNSCRNGDQQQREEGESSPRSYKSEGKKKNKKLLKTFGHPTPHLVNGLFVTTPVHHIAACDSGFRLLSSWQANLFFEPTKFEGTDVLVHRGIYEAAKGMYEQFMPQIIEHLDRYGERAKLQFTGHSLGGSLSLLVHLMLLTRKFVNPSTLRPVVTFGSPFVFCGGQKILDDLGVDDSQIHCVVMHRDIVPRAFSCNYPNHVATLLKRLSGSFRSHPCLIKNKILYSPMGKLFILQPDENSSPPHPLLPVGSALYALDKTQHGFSSNVIRTFLNSPHPLETLSDPTAYGSEGTILRDHDSSNYLKAVNGVLRLHTRMVVRKRGNKEYIVATTYFHHLHTHGTTKTIWRAADWLLRGDSDGSLRPFCGGGVLYMHLEYVHKKLSRGLVCSLCSMYISYPLTISVSVLPHIID